MDFFPIFLDIRNRACLVVGGGVIAARKTESLLRAGAHVVIVAPLLCPELRERLSGKDHSSCGDFFSTTS
jgi:siroheme synthase-like protein